MRLVPAEGPRLEEQEDALGGELVGVVLPADVVEDGVTEGHVAEHPRRPRLVKPLALEDGVDGPRRLVVPLVGLAVDEERPVDVAPGRVLAARQRAEDDDAGVARISPRSTSPRRARVVAESRRARARCANCTPSLASRRERGVGERETVIGGTGKSYLKTRRRRQVSAHPATPPPPAPASAPASPASP